MQIHPREEGSVARLIGQYRGLSALPSSISGVRDGVQDESLWLVSRSRRISWN
jgi:hypothetical protein